MRALLLLLVLVPWPRLHAEVLDGWFYRQGTQDVIEAPGQSPIPVVNLPPGTSHHHRFARRIVVEGTRTGGLFTVTKLLNDAGTHGMEWDGLALAATYYIGAFTNANVVDVPGCGTRTQPCATLAYWRQSRNLGAPGDSVCLAPGVYTSTSPYHCFDFAKTGVTYRGCTADGSFTTDRTKVIVSGSTGAVASPCRGQVVKHVSGDSIGMTLRDLTVNGAPTADNAHCLQFSPQPGQGSVRDLLIDNVRVTNGKQNGLWVGAYGANQAEPFNASNVRILNSEFDGHCMNTGNDGQGIMIAAVNGGEIAFNTIHDNLPCTTTPTGSPPNQTCTRVAFPPSCPSGGCNCDGLHLGGRGFNVHDNEVYRNQEDGIDIGPNGADDDCPATTARFHNIRANRVHDNGEHNLSANGCAHDITIAFNQVWGVGAGLNEYECALWNSNVSDNQFSTSAPALFAYTTMVGFTANRNVLQSSSADATVWLSAGATNAGNNWNNNTVWNTGTGQNVKADINTDASTGRANCNTGSGTNCCTDPDGPVGLGPLPAVGRTSQTTYRRDELAKWKSDGDQGHLFGNETGDTDTWAQSGATTVPPTSLRPSTTTTTTTVAASSTTSSSTSTTSRPPTSTTAPLPPSTTTTLPPVPCLGLKARCGACRTCCCPPLRCTRPPGTDYRRCRR